MAVIKVSIIVFYLFIYLFYFILFIYLFIYFILFYFILFFSPRQGNKSEYLSLVSLSTNPPHVSHGAGPTIDDSHDQVNTACFWYYD